MTRWLVVGAGSIGRQHLAILRAAGEHDLVVVEPNLTTRKDAREFVGKRNAVASMDDAPKYDVALICTPTDLHHSGAMAAAKAGAHVIIEKPVAHVMDGANELIAALGERIGAVACPMRFYDYVVTLKDEIDKGSFGTVYCGRQWYRQNMADWRPGTDYRESYSAMRSRGGGLFLDRIHEMDTARWLFGEPLRLRASWGKSDDLETDTEHVVHALSVHHQAIVTLDMDCLSPGYQCGIQVIGSARQVTCEFDPSMHRKAMEAQTRHWLQCLHGEVEPVQSVKEGYRVLNTALAAYASAGANSEWANFVPQTPPAAVAPEVDATAIAARPIA